MEILNELQKIWISGGVLMWPLLFVAILIYSTAFDLLIFLKEQFIADPFEFEFERMPYISRRTQFLQILVGAAPLIGLLGTVMGMLTTFSGLGSSQGGNSIDLVALGISEALITTETGLLIAIPALFMLMLIDNRQRELSIYFKRSREVVSLNSEKNVSAS
ncbi:MAG: MotA/TolQ/ExbB proton channel family protein [Emcibacteraceae bacterium]|nr:MotA/TolQ/ExbB proton channel family protein [Emcibacteraceae bacterium]